MLPSNDSKRLEFIVDLAWEILFERVVKGRQKLNKEASMQLHLSQIIHEIGEASCVLPGEQFSIELESKIDNKNIDITCSLGNLKAAIELKCFMKSSNRGKDMDLYDVLKDISRLEELKGFVVKRFICLTDNPYYSETIPKGHASVFKLTNQTVIKANEKLIPGWAGKWKNKSRDNHIALKKEIQINWIKSDQWYFLKVDV